MANVADRFTGIWNGKQVPEHLRGGLERYVDHGVVPGEFLQAVIRNDLRGAVGRGDHASLDGLQAIVGWLHCEAPGGCWGSPEKFNAWVAAHAKQARAQHG